MIAEMRKIVPHSFFDRSTLLVTRELLGKFLVRKIGEREVAYMITEVEAYDGMKDLACHARRGKTAGGTYPRSGWNKRTGAPHEGARYRQTHKRHAIGKGSGAVGRRPRCTNSSITH